MFFTQANSRLEWATLGNVWGGILLSHPFANSAQGWGTRVVVPTQAALEWGTQIFVCGRLFPTQGKIGFVGDGGEFRFRVLLVEVLEAAEVALAGGIDAVVGVGGLESDVPSFMAWATTCRLC